MTIPTTDGGSIPTTEGNVGGIDLGNGGGGNVGGTGLARTGSDLMPLVLVGSILLGLGVVFVSVRRSPRNR